MKRKLKANLSIFINGEETIIEVMDSNSRIHFLEITISPEQLSRILSRESMIDCEMDVQGLNKIGKYHHHKTLEFEIPNGLSTTKEELKNLAEKNCPEGWISDNYFGSQNSFFKKDGVSYARTIIRTWTDEKQVD